MNFDAPDANLAACRRDRSNNPLQALNLLNDPVFVEAAQALARRTLTETSPEERAGRMFELALARPPGPREREWILSYVAQQKEIFEKDPEAAQQWSPVEISGCSLVESAAWTGAASALLNLDEFITRE
jgi:hypothetical protein